MASVAQTIKTMQQKFNAAAASGLDLIFQFNIEDAENFQLIIKDGSSTTQPGNADNPNVTLIMDSATFAGIMTGETDGMQAFMAGKLQAEGDMALALKLSELFPV